MIEFYSQQIILYIIVLKSSLPLRPVLLYFFPGLVSVLLKEGGARVLQFWGAFLDQLYLEKLRRLHLRTREDLPLLAI